LFHYDVSSRFHSELAVLTVSGVSACDSLFGGLLMYFAALAGLLSVCGVPLVIAFGVVFFIWLIYSSSVRK